MKRVSEDIRSGDFKQVYLLYGSESYMRRLCLKNLLKALEADENSMNYSVFKGEKISEEEIINMCGTMPFFSDKRVILVEDSGFFKGKADKLADYVKKLPDYVVLIFNEDAADKRGKLYKACAEYSRIIEFAPLNEQDLQKEVLISLAKAGKKIRRQTMDLFLSGTGTDLGYINCEIEKLIAISGERDEITEQDVQDICSPVIENRIFDLVSAVASGNRTEALKRYKELKALKEPAMRMLYLIERQFSQLLSIKQLSEAGIAQPQIAQILKIHPYAVKKSLPLTRKYSEKQLREAVEYMLETEEDVKTGRLAEALSVELVIMKYSA